MKTTIFRALMMYGIAAVISFFVALIIKGMSLGITMMKKPVPPKYMDDGTDQMGLG
jgi:hypothetical protein